jgi:F-type H+-transporting ATPase subunit b
MRTYMIAALLLVLAAPLAAHAQPAETPATPGEAEEARASHAAAGASETGPEGTGEEVEDPSQHFNFFGFDPGHLFDYTGKDEFGGKFGDGEMVDPKTGHHVHEEEPASPPFVFMLLNFAVLLGLLAWKGAPLARKAAEERSDLIKSALDDAAKLRKQAADKLAEYESRLKDADAEIAKLVEGMRKDAEADKQRILAAAETQAAQMKRDAELRIAAEIELARAQLMREVAIAAASAAEQLLRDKMQAADQQKQVANFIADVQGATRKEAR